MVAGIGFVGVPRSMLLRRQRRNFSGLNFRSPINKELWFGNIQKFRIKTFLKFSKAFYMHLDPFTKHAHSMNPFLKHKIQKPLNIQTDCHNVRILFSFFYQHKSRGSLLRRPSVEVERTGFMVNSEGQIFPSSWTSADSKFWSSCSHLNTLTPDLLHDIKELPPMHIFDLSCSAVTWVSYNLSETVTRASGNFLN